jgi:hypothetical protein
LGLLVIRLTKSDGVVALLIPTNPAAAGIVVYTANGLGLVDFSFGEYPPTWELPYESHNPKANKKELLNEIEEMCEAVMAGNCEHGRGLLSIRASIRVGSRTYKVTHLPVLHAALPLCGTLPYISWADNC